MIEVALVLFIGLFGGFAVGAQGAISGAMSQRIGGAAGSFVIHLGGTIASLLLLLSRKGENIEEIGTLPWYMLGAGIFGVILYLTLGQTIPRFGATVAIALLIIGQLLSSIIIDHFGLFNLPVHSIDLTRILGVVVLFAGVYLIIKS